MSEIKIIHTGDNHLGYRQYGYVQREADFYLATAEVAKQAITLEADAVVFAGDIFDAVKPSALAVKMLKNIIKRLKEAGIRCIGIDGNHDSVSGDWMEVCDIENINAKVVQLSSKDKTVTMNIAGIASCRPSKFHAVLEEFKEAGYTDIPVLVIHQSVAELADYSAQDFTALQVSTWVKPLGVQHVAMGDIHGYRETVINGVRFCYCGSPEVKAIDEDPLKTASVITYDGKTVRTAVVGIRTRPFISCDIREEADVDSILVKANQYNVPAIIVGYYSPECKDFVKRAETVLSAKGCMHRFLPISRAGPEIKSDEFNRDGAMMELKDAVEVYFTTGTDEFELVFRLLDAPNDVTAIVKSYLSDNNIAHILEE